MLGHGFSSDLVERKSPFESPLPGSLDGSSLVIAANLKLGALMVLPTNPLLNKLVTK